PRVAPSTKPARAGASAPATAAAASAGQTATPTAAQAAPAGAPKAPKVAKVGSFARAAADRAAHATGMHGADDTETISLPEVFQTTEEPEEPPLPLMHTGSEPPSGNQTRVVVTILVGFLVVVLLLGYCGISSIGSGSSLPLGGSAPRHTSSATTPPATSPSSAPPTSSTPRKSSAPIAVVGASGFDPEGDQSEKDSAASLVLDGDPTTVWQSEGYNSPSFGGLKKGVGVILDLGSPRTVHSVKLTLGNGPADVTVYAAPSRSLDGVSTIGEVQGASGSATLTAPTDLQPARYVIIWFTLIPQDGGRYRASLADVKLS
ncbi:discoidin domain-containing protein, partial [Oryzihumus sp.]|uniref:discoidin domain-containing protein n=1 Tax=Oryzihumus sp. TaxID=1968903 RepID=UPI002EDBB287